MPTTETIQDDMGQSMEIINVWDAVGANGVNNPDDIQVIKALFYCVPRSCISGKYRSSYNSLGAGASWEILNTKIPSPHDSTTRDVVETIKSFQKYANKMLSKYGFKVNVSGRIKPAKKFAVVGKTYSTIAALNLFASMGVARYNSNHIEYIAQHFNGIFSYLLEDTEEERDT